MHHLPLKEEVRSQVAHTKDAVAITVEDIVPETLEITASAVGSAAKPYISASKPCGMPLTTTASAAKRSVSITKSLSHKERFWEKSLYFLTHYAVKVNTLSPQTQAPPGENTPKKHPAVQSLTNCVFMIR